MQLEPKCERCGSERLLSFGVCTRCRIKATESPTQSDVVNNPEHYQKHPSGVQCIAITEHMSFCLGNVIKYVWRADLKGGVEDLRKARWYIDREIQRREK